MAVLNAARKLLRIYDRHCKSALTSTKDNQQPGGFAGCANFMELVFNPRPNDTNLEFDPKQNLYHGKKGRGMIP